MLLMGIQSSGLLLSRKRGYIWALVVLNNNNIISCICIGIAKALTKSYNL